MSSTPSSSSAGISLVASGGKAAFAVLVRTSSRTFWASEKLAAGTQISNSENSEEKTRRASRSSRLYGIFAASSAAVIAEKVPPLAPFQSSVGESISSAGVRSLWSTLPSCGKASTRSVSQSLQCVKPRRYSYLQTGQNIRRQFYNARGRLEIMKLAGNGKANASFFCVSDTERKRAHESLGFVGIQRR